MGRKQLYASEEERQQHIREYQKKYREENKGKILEQSKLKREKKKAKYEVEVIVDNLYIDVSTRFNLLEGYYNTYNHSAIAYKVENLRHVKYVLDAESIKMLCKNGYILYTKYEPRTDSITKLGGFEKIKLVSGEMLRVIHVTNTDIQDLSVGECRLEQVKLGRYNKIKEFMFGYKDKLISTSAKDIKQVLSATVLNAYTMRYTKITNGFIDISSSLGEKYKNRACVISNGKTGEYKIRLDKHVDPDVIVEALLSSGNTIEVDTSLSDIDYDGNVVEHTEKMVEIEHILETVENEVYVVKSTEKIKVLAKVFNVNRSRMQYLLCQLENGKQVIMDTSICNSEMYKNADIADCEHVYTEIDWIDVIKSSNMDKHEYTFTVTINKELRDISLKSLTD